MFYFLMYFMFTNIFDFCVLLALVGQNVMGIPRLLCLFLADSVLGHHETRTARDFIAL